MTNRWRIQLGSQPGENDFEPEGTEGCASLESATHRFYRMPVWWRRTKLLSDGETYVDFLGLYWHVEPETVENEMYRMAFPLRKITYSELSAPWRESRMVTYQQIGSHGFFNPPVHGKTALIPNIRPGDTVWEYAAWAYPGNMLCPMSIKSQVGFCGYALFTNWTIGPDACPIQRIKMIVNPIKEIYGAQRTTRTHA